MERIQRIDATTIRIPLNMPVRVGGYSVHAREYCLVEVVADSGRIGHALALTRGGDLAGAVINNIAPLLVGQDADRVEFLWHTAYENTRLIGGQGLLMRALSLTDIALWDLKAKLWGAPLYRLLGGYRESVPMLMAGGYYADGKGLRELVREYERYAEDGYRHMKLMVGGASMEEDLERYVAVRNELPAAITLGVDANGCWTDAKSALRWVNDAERRTNVPLSFLEEPLPPVMRQETAWLCERTEVPLAIGEFLAGRWAFRDWIEAGAVNILRADVTLCGGISEWKRIASLAQAGNLTILPHYFPSLHIHMAAALPGCDRVETVSAEGRNSSFHLIAGRSYELRDGQAYPRPAPGLGLELDPEVLAAYTVRQMTSESAE